jgi:hypothetical protein
VLIRRVQDGMASSGYESGPLAPSEVCLRGFAEKLTRLSAESPAGDAR